MAVRIDPDGVETGILHELVDFQGKDVLEVGCGDGRMTWRFADAAKSVFAIDPAEPLVAMARGRTPPSLRSSVAFEVADVATLDLPTAAYDVAVIAWSL